MRDCLEDEMNNRFIFRSCLHAMLVALICSAALGFRPKAASYVKGAVTQSSRPLRSVWVIVSQSGQERGRALTGDDGKFYIGNLIDGTYDITVIQGKLQIFSSRINLPANNLFNISIAPPRRR